MLRKVGVKLLAVWWLYLRARRTCIPFPYHSYF